MEEHHDPAPKPEHPAHDPGGHEVLGPGPEEPKSTKWLYVAYVFAVFIPIIVYEFYRLYESMSEPPGP